ncbi:IS3 family transposase [Sulfobacillus thermosulfidooxidans]|uniref:IS3 family transposase n=1 Tax=Sulfobacillus thermosulfidooxidans TaxID=28034 RepID=UPI0002FC8F34|nr:IS3 family transposase [Sulfobacillus thermosulfidooxidans]
MWTANDTQGAEGQVLEWLSALIIAGDGQAYGYRQWTTGLRREHGLIINKKTVYRLLRSADL